MCRLVAYQGEPTFLDALVCAPRHSLVEQSLRAAQAKTVTNGDGFGLGWYGERGFPGLFRDSVPAWHDANLRSLAEQIRSRMFCAHVRATTDTSPSREKSSSFAVMPLQRNASVWISSR